MMSLGDGGNRVNVVVPNVEPGVRCLDVQEAAGHADLTTTGGIAHSEPSVKHLRSRNLFDSADEVGTPPEAGPDLRIAGSLCQPGQYSPFERPEDLGRNWRARDRGGALAQFQDLLHAAWTTSQPPRHLPGFDAAVHQSSHYTFDRAQAKLVSSNFPSHARQATSGGSI
jgi:hypothetical protein